MADAQDLKSWDRKKSCGFKSRHRHHFCLQDSESFTIVVSAPQVIQSIGASGDSATIAWSACQLRPLAARRVLMVHYADTPLPRKAAGVAECAQALDELRTPVGVFPQRPKAVCQPAKSRTLCEWGRMNACA
jgi:hypothetical protein